MTSADVLIVEDEDDIRAMISGILEDEGYQVREAATSQAALDAVRVRKPNLIVLDVSELGTSWVLM